MAESEFRNCPYFQKGPEECCLAKHEERVRRWDSFTADIEFLDGRKMTIPRLAFTEPEIGPIGPAGKPVWASTMMESEEITELCKAGLEALTQESINEIVYTHGGYETTPFSDRCPLLER